MFLHYSATGNIKPLIFTLLQVFELFPFTRVMTAEAMVLKYDLERQSSVVSWHVDMLKQVFFEAKVNVISNLPENKSSFHICFSLLW